LRCRFARRRCRRSAAIRSLIAAAAREPPEVAEFPCIDPVETAADKLSALAWRVRVRDRASAKDDPTIVRHLHDLAALERHVIFRAAVYGARARRISIRCRQGRAPPAEPAAMFADMLQRLDADVLWAREYADFVQAVSFGGPGEVCRFAEALAACSRLTAVVDER
jgi:hypothetical protein